MTGDAASRLREVQSMLAQEAMSWLNQSAEVQLVEQLLVAYAGATARDRLSLWTMLDLRTYQMLLAFAQFMATLAVREHSLSRLRIATLALAFGGSASISDWRDTGISTLPVRDAAFRLGPDSLRLFDEAKEVSAARMAATLEYAKPSFSAWGRMAQEASRWFAQDFWRPSGSGQTFKYGRVDAKVSRRGNE